MKHNVAMCISLTNRSLVVILLQRFIKGEDNSEEIHWEYADIFPAVSSAIISFHVTLSYYLFFLRLSIHPESKNT